MWAKLDDALLDHRKISAAADRFGPDGVLLVLGFFAMALLWSAKHLSEGVLPRSVLKRFPCKDPFRFADALVTSGLFEETGDGNYLIHDYLDWNDTAARTQERRKLAVERQRRRRNGHA